jgi:Leucine-rich repeat (LRR) protein
VQFCDANLKAAVVAKLGVENPTKNDMLLLTSLSANNMGIQCLGGLEYAKNLTTLSLTGNNIADIIPLVDLSNLKTLKIATNKISDLGPLSSLTELDYLWMSSNNVSDLCPLVGLHKLRYIYATSNADLTEETYLTCIPAIWVSNPGLIEFLYDPGCKTTSKADVNGDCHVNMLDLTVVAEEWLDCYHLYNSMCP